MITSVPKLFKLLDTRSNNLDYSKHTLRIYVWKYNCNSFHWFYLDFCTPVAGNPVVIALYIGDTSWNNSFSFRREWSKVLEESQNIQRSCELHCVPSLLLNPDKTFNAFGYEAQENYSRLCEGYNEKRYYYFENITSIFESDQVSFYLRFFFDSNLKKS